MNRWYTSILLFLFSASLVHAQSSEELKKKQKQLREDIEYKEKLIRQIEEDAKASNTKIVLISKKIDQREELISSILEEINLLDEKIAVNEDIIVALEADIARLKEEYARMVIQAYKTRNATDRVMYIFASEDLDQAYQRIKYLQQLTDYRKKQAEAIIRTQSSLERKRQAMEEQRAAKNAILDEQNQEKLTLSQEKQEQEKERNKLSSQEAKYKKDLVAAQKKDAELSEAIAKAIANAVKKPTASGGVALTPEAKELSNNFAANKSKLPWPVEKGVITTHFGEQAHPFLKGIKIKKQGLTFSTTQGSHARAVFDGEVSTIMILPGAGKSIIVRHGEYFTVYTNMSETFVNTGDKVKTKQDLGTVITDKGKTEFEFQLWKGTELLDPSFWIYKGR